jgi:hypothetical protein
MQVALLVLVLTGITWGLVRFLREVVALANERAARQAQPESSGVVASLPPAFIEGIARLLLGPLAPAAGSIATGELIDGYEATPDAEEVAPEMQEYLRQGGADPAGPTGQAEVLPHLRSDAVHRAASRSNESERPGQLAAPDDRGAPGFALEPPATIGWQLPGPRDVERADRTMAAVAGELAAIVVPFAILLTGFGGYTDGSGDRDQAYLSLVALGILVSPPLLLAGIFVERRQATAGRVVLLLALALPLLALISFPFLWDAGALNRAI